MWTAFNGSTVVLADAGHHDAQLSGARNLAAQLGFGALDGASAVAAARRRHWEHEKEVSWAIGVPLNQSKSSILDWDWED